MSIPAHQTPKTKDKDRGASQSQEEGALVPLKPRRLPPAARRRPRAKWTCRRAARTALRPTPYLQRTASHCITALPLPAGGGISTRRAPCVCVSRLDTRAPARLSAAVSASASLLRVPPQPRIARSGGAGGRPRPRDTRTAARELRRASARRAAPRPGPDSTGPGIDWA
jgi:hypothetical protein